MTTETRERYDELCRLCASYDAIKMDIFGQEGNNRQLVDKIQTCLPFKVTTIIHCCLNNFYILHFKFFSLSLSEFQNDLTSVIAGWLTQALPCLDVTFFFFISWPLGFQHSSSNRGIKVKNYSCYLSAQLIDNEVFDNVNKAMDGAHAI